MEIFFNEIENYMKITICGSIAVYENMLEIKKKLEELGHEVDLPPLKVKNKVGDLIPVEEYYAIRKSGVDEPWIWERKKEAILTHYRKEEWADAILVTNFEKNGITGYIGGNTLMEMGVAFFLNKPIYLLNPIPEVSYKEEILGMQPIVINNDLTFIK